MHNLLVWDETNILTFHSGIVCIWYSWPNKAFHMLCVCLYECVCVLIRLIPYQIWESVHLQHKETCSLCSMYVTTDCVLLCYSGVCVCHVHMPECVSVFAAFIQEEKKNLSHIQCNMNRRRLFFLHFFINRLHYINVFNIVDHLAPRSIECAI